MSEPIWRHSTTEKCCGNCQHHKLSDWDDGYVCEKVNGDYASCYTPYDFYCTDYDESERSR